MIRPRMGQWVSTSTSVPGAHTTPDGRAVGVYVREYEDSYGNHVPEHVSFQRPEPLLEPVVDDFGRPVLDADGKPQVRVHHNLDVYVTPNQLCDLQPLTDSSHIPAGRAPHTSLVPEMAKG